MEFKHTVELVLTQVYTDTDAVRTDDRWFYCLDELKPQRSAVLCLANLVELFDLPDPAPKTIWVTIQSEPDPDGVKFNAYFAGYEVHIEDDEWATSLTLRAIQWLEGLNIRAGYLLIEYLGD